MYLFITVQKLCHVLKTAIFSVVEFTLKKHSHGIAFAFIANNIQKKISITRDF